MEKTKITKDVFNAAKLLLASNPRKTVSEVMNIGLTSVHRIDISNTFDEYKVHLNEWQRAHKKTAVKKEETPADTKQTIIYKPTWEMMQEMQKTNELLKLISAKLAFIVDELCGVAKKEG